MSRAARLAGLARSLAIYRARPWRTRALARLYAPFLGQGALAFDIGAHAGDRVRAFRRLGARVVAVEPQPDFVRVLDASFRRDPEVAVVAAAVGRAPGRARLFVAERTPTVTTLSRDWIAAVSRDAAFRRVAWREGPTVAVTTLDALAREHGLPDFLKLDVEGYEAEALAALSQPVRALSFEYVAAAREVALACVERLVALGRYEFNWSPGETRRLASTRWVGAEAVRGFLGALAAGDGSGDVYARLAAEGP